MDDLIIEGAEKMLEKVLDHVTIQGVAIAAASAIAIYFLLAIFSDGE